MNSVILAKARVAMYESTLGRMVELLRGMESKTWEIVLRREANLSRCLVPSCPSSICRMISPERGLELEILLWAEVVAVVWGLDRSDGGVSPKYHMVAPPLVIRSAPLLSGEFSWRPWFIGSPQLVLGSGVSGFGCLLRFLEDLDESISNAEMLEVVEDVPLTIVTETLGGKELGLFFFRRNAGQRSGVNGEG
jgi:hypothetical protein